MPRSVRPESNAPQDRCKGAASSGQWAVSSEQWAVGGEQWAVISEPLQRVVREKPTEKWAVSTSDSLNRRLLTAHLPTALTGH